MNECRVQQPPNNKSIINCTIKKSVSNKL